MINNKSLLGIEPFNELFFNNCFYNSLFSVVNYYNRSILPFLINSISIYKYQRSVDSINLTVDFKSIYNVHDLLLNMGIKQSSKHDNDNLIINLTTSINSGNPIILDVDCFYMPIRKDLYLRTHTPHSILIYGYDNIKSCANIIEQRHVDSLTYDKTELDYNDLIKSFKGYIDNFQENSNELNYCEYSLLDNFNSNYEAVNCLNLQKEIININSKEIESRLESLKSFIFDYEYVFLNETFLENNANNLITGLNDIINSKRAEKYKLNMLYGENYILLGLLDKIVDKWSLIRSRLAKYMFSSIYKQKDFIELKAELNEIYKAESAYYKELLSRCNIV